jgi:hypothetical protein
MLQWRAFREVSIAADSEALKTSFGILFHKGGDRYEN